MQTNSTTTHDFGEWMFSGHPRRCDACGREIPASESYLLFRTRQKRACETCATRPPASPADLLEAVRYATAHRLPVELAYNGTVRVIEPRALVTTRAGNVLLEAIRTDCGERRSYRLDRMQAVAILSEVA